MQENAVADSILNDTKVTDKLKDNIVNDDNKDLKEQPTSDNVDKSVSGFNCIIASSGDALPPCQSFEECSPMRISHQLCSATFPFIVKFGTKLSSCGLQKHVRALQCTLPRAYPSPYLVRVSIFKKWQIEVSVTGAKIILKLGINKQLNFGQIFA